MAAGGRRRREVLAQLARVVFAVALHAELEVAGNSAAHAELVGHRVVGALAPAGVIRAEGTGRGTAARCGGAGAGVVEECQERVGWGMCFNTGLREECLRSLGDAARGNRHERAQRLLLLLARRAADLYFVDDRWLGTPRALLDEAFVGLGDLKI